jgi:hypothetical protein
MDGISRKDTNVIVIRSNNLRIRNTRAFLKSMYLGSFGMGFPGYIEMENLL